MLRRAFIKYKISNLINISKIVTLHYFEFDKHFQYEGESHDFWELVYVDKGEIIVTAKNKEKRLLQGEIIFHKPNEFHNLRADGVVAPNVFIITFVCKSKAMEFFRGKNRKLPVKLRPLISEIISIGKKTFDLPFSDPFMSELKLLENPIIGGPQLIRIHLEELLIKLIQLEGTTADGSGFFLSKGESENKIVAGIIKILSDNIYGNISVGEICAKMNYSKTYLSSNFKNNMGYSIIQYYIKLKIEEAKKLIREENYNFTEISDLLGFNNSHYFFQVFKHTTGMTPKEYRCSVKID